MPDNDTPSSEQTEISYPIQTIDGDVELQDRLTDNVINDVGPTRYFDRDEDTWDEVFARVAKNLAVGEAVHHDKRVDISSDVLADWVDNEVIENGHYDADTVDELFEPVGEDTVGYRKLDEDIAPLVEYDSLVERAPDAVVVDMQEQRHNFERMMRQLQFMPNSPTLMNAGTELQQLSACFVNSPQDDIDNIFNTAQETANVFKSGGGMGYGFHHLRPKGAPIGSTNGYSSGPMTFMNVFDATCGTVKQGGTRRGAQMGIMHAQHPDIGRFVVAKRDEGFAPLASLMDRMGATPPYLRDVAEGNLSEFNISVGMTNEFIEAIENDDQYTFYDVADHGMSDEPFEAVCHNRHFYSPEFEDAWNEQYDKADECPHCGDPVEENLWRDYEVTGVEEYKDAVDIEVGEPLELPGGLIWQLMIDGAHQNGEPGFVHLDEINEMHSFDVDEYPEHTIDSTNPCGEQPLQEKEACNLGHLNLSLVVDDDAVNFDWWSGKRGIDVEDGEVSGVDGDLSDVAQEYLDDTLDQEMFDHIVETGTRFLDNVVTMSRFPVEEIEYTVRRHRKIGFGLMGFAEMLMQMGVPYGSEVSYAIAEEIQRRITAGTVRTSHLLAQERGVFPKYGDSKWSEPTEYADWVELYGQIDPENHEGGFPMRNHNTTTIAPTGTTSMVGNTTGGCEPLFSVAYFKNVGDDIQGGSMLVVIDDYFEAVLKHNDYDVESIKDDIESLMMTNKFDGVESIDSVPDELGDVFTVTKELSSKQHIEMQAAFQTYNHSGISKSCNLPNEATRQDVSDAVLLALDKGIKGATVYRDGSRSEQVMSTRLDNELDDPLLQYLDLDDVVGTVLSNGDPIEYLEQAEDVNADSVAGKILSDSSEQAEDEEEVESTDEDEKVQLNE